MIKYIISTFALGAAIVMAAPASAVSIGPGCIGINGDNGHH